MLSYRRIKMEDFVNVSVIKKANVYFEGKVTSRTIIFENGEKKTLGIMLPGEYEFGTEKKEIMEILGGNLKVKLPNSDIWSSYTDGDTFEVEKNSSFKLIVNEIVDDCCSYIEV
jgi:purine/pyrimidine-nucleoside phosphorylase